MNRSHCKSIAAEYGSRNLPGGFSIFLIHILLLLTGGCVKNEFSFEFDLPKDINATYRLSYYASDSRGGVEIETAMALVAGKSDIKGFTRNPTIVSVYFGRNQLPSALIYARRGDKVSIKGDGPDPLYWQIGGNSVNESLTSWRLENKSLLLANLRGNAGKEQTEALNGAVADYVKANPKSEAAAIIFNKYYDSHLNPKQYSELSDLLAKAGFNEEFLKLMVRQDLGWVSGGGLLGKSGDKAGDMIVQSYSKNIDTLRMQSGKGVPVMLWLWQRRDLDTDGQAQYRSQKDSIRRILIDRGDSSKGVISDLSLGMDSITWAYRVKTDSLRGVVRARTPKGLADSAVIALGVRRTPWFVVADGNGKILYSGSEWERAAKQFRSKLKK